MSIINYNNRIIINNANSKLGIIKKILSMN